MSAVNRPLTAELRNHAISQFSRRLPARSSLCLAVTRSCFTEVPAARDIQLKSRLRARWKADMEG